MLLLMFVLLYSNCVIMAQESCKVLKPEIAEKYTGKCKNGLAHGKGIAEGKDKYEGSFKNGLPNGKGKYTWSNGEAYDGEWKDGKRDGKGKFYYKKDGVDSVKFGVWSEDLFVKRIIPAPYKVIRSMGVARYSVRKIGEGEKVLFSFLQNGSINSSISNLHFAPSSGTACEVGSKQGYENIVFPCTCSVSYSSENSFKSSVFQVDFEIEITEPGVWEVILNN